MIELLSRCACMTSTGSLVVSSSETAHEEPASTLRESHRLQGDKCGTRHPYDRDTCLGKGSSRSCVRNVGAPLLRYKAAANRPVDYLITIILRSTITRLQPIRV